MGSNTIPHYMEDAFTVKFCNLTKKKERMQLLHHRFRVFPIKIRVCLPPGSDSHLDLSYMWWALIEILFYKF